MLKGLFKTFNWYNAGNGCINIDRDVDKKAIEKILTEENLFQIQFHNLPSLRTWEYLNNYLFNKRPDVFLRLNNFNEPLLDFSFLKLMNNLENLFLDIYDLTDLKQIGELNQLKKLILGETKSNSISLQPISQLTKLNYLYITGLKKDIEAISRLKLLRELTLKSLTLDNLDFLSELELLERIHIIFGGTKNYSALTKLPKLKLIELWQVKMLSDIQFISEIKNLEILQLAFLKHINRLPNFSNLKNLKKLTIDTLNGLKDVSSISEIESLEELLVIAANNFSTEQFDFLKNCKNLRMASVGFGSLKKNELFNQFRNSIGLDEFHWTNSNYA